MSKLIWENWQPELVIKSIEVNAYDRLERVCERMIKLIRASMKETKTGRTYYLDGMKHIAAADGETPAIRLKTLYEALEYRIEKVGGNLVATIGVNLDSDDIGYAMYLEIGTQYMGAKPYLRNTFFENDNEMKKILGVI